MPDKIIINALAQSAIKYELYQHPKFTTCEISSAWHKSSDYPGVRVKNLFLRNKNGKQHLLLLLPHELDFDKKIFKALSGEKCGMASDDRLWEYLKVLPGAVSPLSLIHDTNQHVKVFIEQSLLQQASLHLHPGNSEWSVQINPTDLLKLLESWKYKVYVVDWKGSDTTS